MEKNRLHMQNKESFSDISDNYFHKHKELRERVVQSYQSKQKKTYIIDDINEDLRKNLNQKLPLLRKTSMLLTQQSILDTKLQKNNDAEEPYPKPKPKPKIKPGVPPLQKTGPQSQPKPTHFVDRHPNIYMGLRIALGILGGLLVLLGIVVLAWFSAMTFGVLPAALLTFALPVGIKLGFAVGGGTTMIGGLGIITSIKPRAIPNLIKGIFTKIGQLFSCFTKPSIKKQPGKQASKNMGQRFWPSISYLSSGKPKKTTEGKVLNF